MIRLVCALIVSYLIGSIPTAYLLVKRLKGVDVRTVGSGNVGATNVTRAAGLAAGSVVFLVDLAKGWVAAAVIAPWLNPHASMTARLACGLFAVIGHTAPIWLRFQGGKGVATTIGALLGAAPMVAAVYLMTWAIVALISRYVSAGSLLAAASIPIAQAALRRPGSEIVFGGLLTLLIVVRHHANITRLLQGTEPRIGHPRSNSRVDEPDRIS